MDRHDTHLLSEESGVKEKEEDAHQFNFNDSINLSYDSEDKLVSKETVNNSPLHLNYIEQNNIENNNNNNNNNISIISSKEIGDIFHGQENNTKINKKKKKPKKNKYFIKLRKIKLNNDDSNEIVENCLTYFPTLRNDIIDKKINKLIDKSRKCVSLNNKNKNNKKRNKLKNHRKLNSLNEKEFLYFFYNDDNKGNQNLRNMLNIINKQKTRLLKVTNNFFSIKNKEKIGTKANNKYPLINTKNKTNKNKTNSQDNDKSNKLKKNNKDNSNYRKINNLNSNKNKPKLILNKNNNNNKSNYNNNNSSKRSNNKKFLVNTNYSNKNTSKSKIRKSSNQSTSLISTKNNEKVGMIYNKLYGYGMKKQRVKSTESLFENKPNRVWHNINDYKDQTFLNVYKKNKKENRIKTKKLFCSQNGSLINHFSRHFGNNKNCPVCLANKHKHDESIREKGICPMIPNIGDDDSQSRLQNRRVYSALSRVLSKMNRNHNEFDFLKNNLNDSKTKNRFRNKINRLNYGNKMFKIYFNGANNRFNLKRSESAVVRKEKVDRTLFKENNSSINNQIDIHKNQSVKN